MSLPPLGQSDAIVAAEGREEGILLAVRLDLAAAARIEGWVDVGKVRPVELYGPSYALHLACCVAVLCLVRLEVASGPLDLL